MTGDMVEMLRDGLRDRHVASGDNGLERVECMERGWRCFEMV